MSKQNITTFQQAMSTFLPFSQEKGNGGNREATAAAPGETAGNTAGDAAAGDGDAKKIQDLEGRLSEIKKRLDELTSK